MLARIEMMAMTTNNSIRVKPSRAGRKLGWDRWKTDGSSLIQEVKTRIALECYEEIWGNVRGDRKTTRTLSVADGA